MERFWNFKNIANSDDNQIELLLEGDIIDYDDAWLYEWLGIPYSGKNKFRQELKNHKDKDIVLKIDSNGGSVWAATGIYDALKEHPGKVTVKITRAASSATIPAMAGDEILISLVGLFMIHNPFPANGVFGDANQLREVADMLDTVKEIIINAYMTKTNLSKEEIWSLMDNETLMSANMAVEKGFVDGIIDNDNDNEFSNINNKGFSFSRLAIVNSASESIQKAISKINDNNQNDFDQSNNLNGEGEETLEIKNVEELRNAYPELVNDLVNSAREEGAVAERERIKGIDEISNTIDPELAHKAKFEEPMNAEKLAFEALKADNKKGSDYLENRNKDVANSKAENIQANSTDDEENKPKTVQDKAKNIVASFDAKRRGVNING